MTEFNYVSRTFGKALVLTTVDHVSFSPDGSWMATVSSCGAEFCVSMSDG